MKVIDAENPLDLSQEPSEQSEVSSSHTDKSRYDLREELFVGKCNAGRCPFLFEQFWHLSRIKRAEFMIVDPTYLSAGEFSEGFAPVKMDRD
jgi:hypothetical protein